MVVGTVGVVRVREVTIHVIETWKLIVKTGTPG